MTKGEKQNHKELPCYYHERVRIFERQGWRWQRRTRVSYARERTRSVGCRCRQRPQEKKHLDRQFQGIGNHVGERAENPISYIPGQPHIIDCIMMNEGIDPNRDFIDDLAPIEEIQKRIRNFGAEVLGRWQSKRHLNINSGRTFSRGEHLHRSREIGYPLQPGTLPGTPPRYRAATRATDENTVDSITVDEL